MGASFDYMITTSYDKNDAENEFQSARSQAAYEYGMSYSGSINMLVGKIVWKDLRVEGESAATDIIERTHKKGSPPIAVSFKSQFSSEPSRTEFNRWIAQSGFDKFNRSINSSNMQPSRFKKDPISFIVDGSGYTFYLSDFNGYPELKNQLIDLHADFLLFLDEAKRKAGGINLVWAIGGYCSS